MGLLRSEKWKEAGDAELRLMVAILAAHLDAATGDARHGPWVIETLKTIGAGTGRLSPTDKGHAIYQIAFFLGAPLEVRLDDEGRPCELQGPKLLLRQGAQARSPSGRWKSVPPSRGPTTCGGSSPYTEEVK